MLCASRACTVRWSLESTFSRTETSRVHLCQNVGSTTCNPRGTQTGVRWLNNMQSEKSDALAGPGGQHAWPLLASGGQEIESGLSCIVRRQEAQLSE